MSLPFHLSCLFLMAAALTPSLALAQDEEGSSLRELNLLEVEQAEPGAEPTALTAGEANDDERSTVPVSVGSSDLAELEEEEEMSVATAGHDKSMIALGAGLLNAGLHADVELLLRATDGEGTFSDGEQWALFAGLNFPAGDIEAHEVGLQFGGRRLWGASHYDPAKRTGHAIFVQAWYGTIQHGWYQSSYSSGDWGYSYEYSAYEDNLNGVASSVGYQLRTGRTRLRGSLGIGYSPKLAELDSSGFRLTLNIGGSFRIAD
jgi:hypothetical protein